MFLCVKFLVFLQGGIVQGPKPGGWPPSHSRKIDVSHNWSSNRSAGKAGRKINFLRSILQMQVALLDAGFLPKLMNQNAG